MATYYVYRHLRKDNLQTFYIGCGKMSSSKENKAEKLRYSRAFEIRHRNKGWHKVYLETSIWVDIVYETTDKHLAYQKENDLIAEYGRICAGTGTLVNISRKQGGWQCKRITQKTKEGVFIKTWDSAIDIEIEHGYYVTNIIKVCKKKQVTAYGYLWEYADDRSYDKIYAQSPTAKSYVNNKSGIVLVNRQTNEKLAFRNQASVAKFLGTYRNNIQRYLHGLKFHKDYIIRYRKPLAKKPKARQ